MQLKNPKVSVIIPVYNGEKSLYNCLNSVLEQTYKNYEVIVVNNNSKDQTKNIIGDFERKSNKISPAFESYQSRGAARNKGIQKSNGEIIAMIDADCIAPKNWIAELTKPITKENENAVMGFQEDLIKNFWTRNVQKNDLRFMKSLRKGKYIDHIDTKNFAIKSLLIKNLLFNKKIRSLEDFELYLRLKRVSNVRFLSNVRVGHYHKSSFFRVVLTQFNRGYWVKKIYDLHDKEKNNLMEPMFEKIPLNNIIKNLKNIFLPFINNPNKETFYSIIEETSWSAGIIWSYIY